MPSNLILAKVGARRWIARILIAWGLVSMGMMFVTDVTSFYIARVLLGIAEAGFFPGMVLYLTYWIPAADRATHWGPVHDGRADRRHCRRTGLGSAAVAARVGRAAGMAMALRRRRLCLRWSLGVLALRVLTDTPEQATWLAKDERDWLIATLKREQVERQSHHRASLLRTLLRASIVAADRGVFSEHRGHVRHLSVAAEDPARRVGRERFRLTAMTMVPFIAALIGMVLIGRHSDRTAERKWHVAACALTAAVGLVLAVVSGDNIVAAGAQLHAVADRPTVGRQRLLGDSADLSWRNGGSSRHRADQRDRESRRRAGPSIIGWLRDVTGAYDVSLLVLAGVLLLEAILAASLRLPASSRRLQPSACDTRCRKADRVTPGPPQNARTSSRIAGCTGMPSSRFRFRVASVRSPGYRTRSISGDGPECERGSDRSDARCRPDRLERRSR